MSAVISLTTIPDRIEHIEPCIRSLVAQGLPVYLWAVKKIERSDTVLGELPAFLADAGVHVEIVPDCGPITKLLPALRAGFDVILTADDDCTYGKGWAEQLLAWSEKRPKAALGFRGRVLRSGCYLDSKIVTKNHIKKPVGVHVITGVSGALYRATMFDDGIYTEWECWPMNDDLVIAAHLKRRGVPCLVVPGQVSVRDKKVRFVTPLAEFNTQAAKLNDEGIALLGLAPEKRKESK